MKKLILFLFILNILLIQNAFCISSFALGTGGVTPHFVRHKKNYCNQWNNTGIIVNKSYYAQVMAEDVGFSYMIGNDSICSRIEGAFFIFRLEQYEHSELNFVIGSYNYLPENWERNKRKTPSEIDAPEPVSFKSGDKMWVPVVAINWNLYLIDRPGFKFILNNLFTPVITNHSLMFRFEF